MENGGTHTCENIEEEQCGSPDDDNNDACNDDNDGVEDRELEAGPNGQSDDAQPFPQPPEASDGRVRVLLRLRPMSDQEKEDGREQAVDTLEDGHAVRLKEQSGLVREFRYDSVFQKETSQTDVFVETGLPVLRSCMNGVNGSILAYGQTGSGKTYSLLHQGSEEEEAGLLPRIVFTLFVQIAQDDSHVYEVEAAAAQIYNEDIDDLLHLGHHRGVGNKLEVQQGGVIMGLTWVKCQHPEEMLDLFSRARSNIVYAETKMNKHSSRSHAIFQMRIAKRIRVTEVPGDGIQQMDCTRSRLIVADLAGSERMKKSGAAGMRLWEATRINKSLLALGNVFNALAARKVHVPFRDSKLTRILEGSIGGNCKTNLLVCASPSSSNVQETLNCLEFAHRAMCVRVTAQVNSSQMEVDARALEADLRRDPRLEALRHAGSKLAGRNLIAREKTLIRGPRRYNSNAPRGGRFSTMADQAEENNRLWQEHLDQGRQRAAEEAAEQFRQAAEQFEQSAARWRSSAGTGAEAAAAAQEEAAAAELRYNQAEARASLSELDVNKWQEHADRARTALESAELEISARDRLLSEFMAQAEAAEIQLFDASKRCESIDEDALREREKAVDCMRAAESRVQKAHCAAEMNAGAVADWQEFAGAAQAALEAAWSEASVANRHSAKQQRDAAKSALAANGRERLAESLVASLRADVARWKENAETSEMALESAKKNAVRTSCHTDESDGKAQMWQLELAEAGVREKTLNTELAKERESASRLRQQHISLRSELEAALKQAEVVPRLAKSQVRHGNVRDRFAEKAEATHSGERTPNEESEFQKAIENRFEPGPKLKFECTSSVAVRSGEHGNPASGQRESPQAGRFPLPAFLFENSDEKLIDAIGAAAQTPKNSRNRNSPLGLAKPPKLDATTDLSTLLNVDWNEHTSKYLEWIGVSESSDHPLYEVMCSVLKRGLPDGWTIHVDTSSRVYFWNRKSGESVWTHPDHDIMIGMVQLYQKCVKQADKREFLRHVLRKVQSDHDPRRWSGPYQTDDGDKYWYDKRKQESVWNDPWRRDQLRAELIKILLTKLGAPATRSLDTGALAFLRSSSTSDLISSPTSTGRRSRSSLKTAHDSGCCGERTPSTAASSTSLRDDSIAGNSPKPHGAGEEWIRNNAGQLPDRNRPPAGPSASCQKRNHKSKQRSPLVHAGLQMGRSISHPALPLKEEACQPGRAVEILSKHRPGNLVFSQALGTEVSPAAERSPNGDRSRARKPDQVMSPHSAFLLSQRC